MDENGLIAFFAEAKQELLLANEDRRHPFRLCTFAVNDLFPTQRIIVKRETNLQLANFFYTDSRSAKVQLINSDPRTSLLFYNPDKKLQIIIQATTEVVTDGLDYEKHKQIALQRPLDYSSELAPGSKIDIEHYEFTTESNFCLLKSTPVSIQIHQLGSRKHKRALYEVQDGWAGQWLVP